jgi:hypothetical protein
LMAAPTTRFNGMRTIGSYFSKANSFENHQAATCARAA